MKNDNYKIVLGAVVGAAVAGVATLLFAPKSGKNLRKDISNKTDEAIDTAEGYMDVAKDKGSDALETAKEAGSDLAENSQRTMDEMGSDIERAADHAEKGYTETAKYDLERAGDKQRKAGRRAKNIAKDSADDVQDTAEEAKKEAKNK